MNKVVDRIGSICKVAPRVAFLGVGSPLRADDSVGLHIVESLQQTLKPTPDQEFQFFLGESAPENFSGAIRVFGPTHLLIFDAADLNLDPGSFALIEEEQIGGISFSTHMLPLKILTAYLTATTSCEVVVVGVQPKMMEFAYPMTPEVRQAADQFISRIQTVLN